jgi:hypothetical protein
MALVLPAKDYPVPGMRVQVAGQEVYALSGRQNTLMAVYQLASGSFVGLLADELAWLSNTADVTVPEHCHITGEHLMFRVAADGHTSALVIADVLRTVERAKYGKEAGEGTDGMTYIPAVTEPADPIVLAVVVAFKYS